VSTALGAITEIPADAVHGEWLRFIVSESKASNELQVDVWLRDAEARARRHGETSRAPKFEIGTLVLLHKPFYEKGTGQILPQCDGPFEIIAQPSPHVCILADPYTGEPFDHTKPVSVARLVRFEFPTNYAEPVAGEFKDLEALMASMQVGKYVAIEYHSRIHVARVERFFREQTLESLMSFGFATSHVPRREKALPL